MESLRHGTSEQWELYALGRLDPDDTAKLEEHLYICSNCQEKFEEAEIFALGMRDALRQEPVVVAKPAAKPAMDWFGWMRSPSFAVAGGLAFVLLLGILVMRPGGRAVLPAASFQLSAMRGASMTVSAASEFDITLTDAPRTGGPFRAEMVDGTSQKIWSGMSTESAQGAQIKVQVKAIEPGDYFVRLYRGDGKLLHEYELHVK